MTEPIITLDAKYYHDPQIYERECDAVFRNEWLLFGHEAALDKAGAYIARTIAGYPVFVIRDKNGDLKAHHNVCRHRASQILADGTSKTSILRCQYHGWVYDTDGNLKKAPDFGGDHEALCDRTNLYPVHVKTWRKLIFICMAEGDAPNFDKSLGDLPKVCEGTDLENFHFHSAATHQIKCNWKTYIENYMEGYHIPTIHPGLSKEVDMNTYFVHPGDRIAQHVTDTPADMKEDALNEGLWVWHWPYAALNVYKAGMNLELAVPTGPETVELQYSYFFRDVSDDLQQANDKTIDMSHEVTQEDIDICENVQKNLKAGIYGTGELSPRHEMGLKYFQDMVRKAND